MNFVQKFNSSKNGRQIWMEDQGFEKHINFAFSLYKKKGQIPNKKYKSFLNFEKIKISLYGSQQNSHS